MPVITYFKDDDGDKWEVVEGRLRLNGHALADAREFADFIYAELAKADPAKPDDGWIEWNGGECPVDLEALVDLTTRKGGIFYYSRAAYRDWRHRGLPNDIIAYRLAKGGEA